MVHHPDLPKVSFAAAYCSLVGLDPNELVWGYEQGSRERLQKFRWEWMLGVSPSVADGATTLSPRQRALGHGFARPC